MDSFDLVNKIGIDEEEIDSKGNRVEASFIEMDERLAENLSFSQDNNLFEYGR